MFSAQNPSNKQSMLVKVDFRILSLLLLIALAVCVFLWKPWATSGVAARKITVTGTATVKGTPDEYQLSPYFEFTGDHDKAVLDANAKSTEVTAELKKIGVKDTEIKSNTNSYDKFLYTVGSDGTQDNLQLSYTITLTNKDTAQKVQDYFLNASAKGQISPYATFSEAKQKELAAQARQNAIDDAKKTASTSASQVELKLGKVVTITDNGSSGGCGPYGLCSATMATDVAVSSAESAKASIPVQTGQNDFSSTVQVEYELR